jgi:hypothetical protein
MLYRDTTPKPAAPRTQATSDPVATIHTAK